MSRSDPLRNPAIASALEEALAHRTHDKVRSLLVRSGGLPGPRPNWRLAWAFARVVAEAGSKGDALVAELVAMNAERAPPRSALEFLPLVGAFCLAARAFTAPDFGPELGQLSTMAEDARHLVREAVALALVELGRDRPEELAAALETWTQTYLPAAVALTSLSARAWLDRLASAEQVIARFDEAFALAENASRSDRRSQGYRALVDALAQTPGQVMDRFPAPMLAWLEARAATHDVALREALQALIAGARSRGQRSADLDGVQAGLDASAPPRRDPRTYVGPTRRRGGRS